MKEYSKQLNRRKRKVLYCIRNGTGNRDMNSMWRVWRERQKNKDVGTKWSNVFSCGKKLNLYGHFPVITFGDRGKSM